MEGNLGTMFGQLESWINDFIHQVECLISCVIRGVARLQFGVFLLVRPRKLIDDLDSPLIGNLLKRMVSSRNSCIVGKRSMITTRSKYLYFFGNIFGWHLSVVIFTEKLKISLLWQSSKIKRLHILQYDHDQIYYF